MSRAVDDVRVGSHHLPGLLGIPAEPIGLVIFAHGSGSGRFSPRNNHVASALREHHIATLLVDLLTEIEEQDRHNVFDIMLLASRLQSVAEWSRQQPGLKELPIGYFGASTGAAAALVAAAAPNIKISAIVSRGGRPDLARDAIALVRAPTLLLIGSLDEQVIALNQRAFGELVAPKKIQIIPGAGHLFEEPGTLDQVIRHATDWFSSHFVQDRAREA
ncbi:MAG: alpha/beta hydrolase [Sphingorhabdus sp.]